MTLNPNFSFPPHAGIQLPEAPFPGLGGDLGPLESLLGNDESPAQWVGKGFNCIWRPNSTPGSDHFLELNVTNDRIVFERIPGAIPNRGLLQPDIKMFGLSYLQQIKDANLDNEGLHFEPGIWAVVPKTSNPMELPSIVRMASIPHGSTILAQGSGFQHPDGPAIAATSITPFAINNPSQKFTFAEADLATPSDFRSPGNALTGITQSMLDNPNSLLVQDLAGKTVKQTTTLMISSDAGAPVSGGGVTNTAFLQGAPSSGPNAQTALVSATFWIELIQGNPDYLQLQYTQVVMLNFAGLSWPHVTVATLRKQAGEVTNQ